MPGRALGTEVDEEIAQLLAAIVDVEQRLAELHLRSGAAHTGLADMLDDTRVLLHEMERAHQADLEALHVTTRQEIHRIFEDTRDRLRPRPMPDGRDDR